jgi:hypothetical protein
MNNIDGDFHRPVLKWQMHSVLVSIQHDQVTQEIVHLKIRFNYHVK